MIQKKDKIVLSILYVVISLYTFQLVINSLYQHIQKTMVLDWGTIFGFGFLALIYPAFKYICEEEYDKRILIEFFFFLQYGIILTVNFFSSILFVLISIAFLLLLISKMVAKERTFELKNAFTIFLAILPSAYIVLVLTENFMH
ncbi:MAG: hypothetical protein ACRCUP_01755 [Mycoplasmatales bacterium]